MNMNWYATIGFFAGVGFLIAYIAASIKLANWYDASVLRQQTCRGYVNLLYHMIIWSLIVGGVAGFKE